MQSRVYDAGNLTGGNGAVFEFDGLNQRIHKSYAGTVRDFSVGLDGQPFNEYQGASWQRTTGGLFTYANGTTYFNRTDQQGTQRVSTDPTGTIIRTNSNQPFGDGENPTTPYADFTGFAGGFWDSENNADHFGAREYAKTQGRWLTPDPAGLAAVDPANPQTWNRYAYVANNPLSYVDPLGLNRCADCGPCNPDAMDCGSSGGSPSSPGGGGGFCDASGDCGLGIDGLGTGAAPWEPYPGYNITSISGAAGLLSQINGWYKNCVSFNFNCDSSGNPLGADGNPDYTITVACGGSLSNVTCLPPPQAVFGSSPFSTNLLYPGLAPGDVPAGSLADGVFQSRVWQNAYNSMSALTTVYAGAPLVLAAPDLAIGGAAAAETYGVPVTAWSIWTIQNWNNLMNWRKIGIWAYGECQTYGPC